MAVNMWSCYLAFWYFNLVCAFPWFFLELIFVYLVAVKCCLHFTFTNRASLPVTHLQAVIWTVANRRCVLKYLSSWILWLVGCIVNDRIQSNRIESKRIESNTRFEIVSDWPRWWCGSSCTVRSMTVAVNAICAGWTVRNTRIRTQHRYLVKKMCSG